MKPDKKWYIQPNTVQMVEIQKALANVLQFQLKMFPN